MRLGLLKEGKTEAMFTGAVIVSVEVPGLEPSITGDCEKLQEGNGAGPVTVQASVTGPEKPFCPANVRASVTCAPVCAVRLVAAGVKEKSGGGVKVAVTACTEFMVTLQALGSVPEQAPLHPANTDPVAGTAVRETVAPGK